MPLQIRRGTEAERVAMTQPLAQGELLYVTNTQRIYVGNGSTLGGIAVTGYTDGNAKDAAAAIFTSGSHSGINFAYNTATDIITATVDLSNYNGTINASALKGTIVADDSTILVDAVAGTFNLDGTVKGHIVPDANETYDLGSAAYRFRDIYLSGTSIKLGSATITATGSVVNLPLGSTIGGQPISQDGVVQGSNYNINIIRDDSTVMINSATGLISTDTVNASFINGNYIVGTNIVGDITGSVFSQDSTQLVDALHGLVVGPINNQSIDTEEITINALADNTVVLVNAITSGLYCTNQIFQTSRGSVSNPQVVQSGDPLFVISSYAYDGTDYVPSFVIATGVDSAVPIVGSNIPGTLSLIPFSDGGVDNSKGVYIDSRGWVGIRTAYAQPEATLDINGFAKLAILNAAPTGPVNGMIAIASGTGWDPLGMAGKQQMVAYLGGGWRQIAVQP